MPGVFVRVFLFFFFASAGSFAQSLCPARPSPGSIVADTRMVSSVNGVLNADLTMTNYKDAVTGVTLYCYAYGNGLEATTSC
jgi:hypothetical protein